MFTRLSDLIPGTAIRLGIDKETQAARVCHKYRLLAPRVIHGEILKHTLPRFSRKSILDISVQNSAWAELLIKNKRTLIDEINKSLGKPLIKGIKTRVSMEDVFLIDSEGLA